MPAHRDHVRTYYEQNTRLFLLFGSSRKAQNIHRGLWIDGTKTLAQALDHTNERIRAEIENVVPERARLADLGCGVGAGLLYMFPRLTKPEYAVGVTLSPLQARLANESAKELRLDDRILFAESDFSCMPLENGSLDAAYAVESLVHAPDPESVFCEASRLLRTGGRLLVLDDCRAARTLSPPEEAWLDAFIRGWHVPGVRSAEQFQSIAKRYELQLVKNEDFTPFLRLRNLPNAIAELFRFLGSSLPIRHAILPSMLGSMALQQCLHSRIIEYRFLVFEKI